MVHGFKWGVYLGYVGSRGVSLVPVGCDLVMWGLGMWGQSVLEIWGGLVVHGFKWGCVSGLCGCVGSMKLLQSMGLGVCGVNGYSGKECYKSGDVVWYMEYKGVWLCGV